jgi:Fe-S oxidoreductase
MDWHLKTADLVVSYGGSLSGEHGWKREHVKKALDLCLACTGCKVECPVQTDMATYKAEFLAHRKSLSPW